MIRLAQIVLWPHPLVWRMGEAHRFACDVRSDGAAQRGDPTGYSALLAQTALLLRKNQPTVFALGFIGKCEAIRRVKLVKNAFATRQVKQWKLRIVGLALFAILGGLSTVGVSRLARARSQDSDSVEMRQAALRVLDPDGEPLSGASIEVWGLRPLKQRASGHGNHATLRMAKTGKDGIALLPYPRYVFEEMETGALIFTVRHENYAPFEEQTWLISEANDIQLAKGRRIELGFRDLESQPFQLEELHVITPSAIDGWKTTEQKTLLSRPLAKLDSPLLVVGLQEDGLPWFSDFIRVSQLLPETVAIRGVKLKPGRKISGRLSDNVPRPVKNGVVHLVVSGTYSDQPSSGNTVMWRDTATVAEDGTFAFESVPRGFPVYCIANCEGWVSESCPAEEILQSYSYVNTLAHAHTMHETIVVAQPFPHSEADNPVIKMEPTADCEFQIVGPDGHAIAGVSVSISANYSMFPGPGGILGDYTRSLDELESDRVREPSRSWGLCHATTDANGYAVIRDMPRQRGHSVGAWHKKFELPPHELNQFSRQVDVDLSQGDKNLMIRLQPRGKEVLGR
ncbi:MAG: hypothetical protein AAF483_13520 [Planctomycetota bacterium]